MSVVTTRSQSGRDAEQRRVVAEAERALPGERPEEAVDDGKLVEQPRGLIRTPRLGNSSGRASRATAVEHAVHQPRLVGVEEGAGDVDIFVDDDARRHVAPLQELEDAAAQDGAERQVDARERPGRRQRRVDDRIDAALLLDHAADERAEEGDIGRPQLLAFQLAAEPVRLELRDDGRQRRAADIHLVERLHGAEPRGAALVGGLRPRRIARAQPCASPSFSRSAAISNAAAAAAAPLFFSLTARAPRPARRSRR